ncbi:hypothetical protein JOD54_005478 [Actinokineospora baliensis]|uniref:hypothetical protein n=1 Tax=Actinokineospora baliensis TaxID=547056 RepID=UPI00195B5863|nr:hypothetical protein [Actinokineospora baliensis]MBM7775274.1 hypothetical protein [Actinokineospora baliensis]
MSFQAKEFPVDFVAHHARLAKSLGLADTTPARFVVDGLDEVSPGRAIEVVSSGSAGTRPGSTTVAARCGTR